ncbi:MAG: right-handed parallel beta-helix repeat-containing protein [Lachnospiraceae bacterium]|nr:right-handed parallel beta-helix repeat-containing protein [Lachnospiraceae bacterium]
MRNKFYRAMSLCALIPALVTAVIILYGAVGKTTGTYAASYAKTISLGLKDGQDATAEIQNALNEAAKAGTKKKQALVTVPAGTYYISRTLVIGSNTCLKLDKDTVIKKNPNPKDPILYMLRTRPGDKGKYADTSKITIEGGMWDAGFIKYNDTSGGTVFFLTHTSNLKILNVTLCNNFGTHLIELGGAKKVTVKGCTLYGFEASGSDVEKEAVQLDICHDESISPAGGPFDDTPCSDVTISGCEIYDYPRAVGSHMMVEGIYHRNIKIVGNNIHGISGAAVYGYNYVKAVIKDNRMTDVGCGIQIKTDSVVAKTKLKRLDGVKAMTVSGNKFDIKISGNTITVRKDGSEEDAGSGGSAGIFIYGSGEYPMGYVTMSDNTVVCNSSAVYLRYVDHAVVDKLTADRHEGASEVDTTAYAEDAVKLLACKSAIIKECRISTVTDGRFENGIALRDSSSAELKGNTVNYSAKYGIAVYDSAITGSGNVVSDSADNGIKLENSSACLTDLNVTGAGGHGIKMNDSSLELETGRITDSLEHGVTMSGDGTLKLTKVEFTGNKGNVIQINSGTILIENCTFSENAGTAVQIKGGDNVINNCVFVRNLDNAIQVRDGSARISGNEFTDNCLEAVDGKVVAIFSLAKAAVTDNKFRDPLSASEIWVQSGAETEPEITTARTSKAAGTEDAAGNKFFGLK